MSQSTLIFATHNAHKLEEVKAMLSATNVDLISLSELGYNQDIAETGDTLLKNASIKSQTIYKAKGQSVFADDSGLEVMALDMAPGVHTARYAGEAKDNQANMRKLLQALEKKTYRTARFRTVISLIWKGEEHFFEGIVNGKIAHREAGAGGFGYDPVFIPYGYDETFATLPLEVKNGISHRYRAICNMQKFIELQLS